MGSNNNESPWATCNLSGEIISTINIAKLILKYNQNCFEISKTLVSNIFMKIPNTIPFCTYSN